MKKIYFIGAILLLFSASINAQGTITKAASNYNVEETVKKLKVALKNKGLTVFSVIDHKKGAAATSLELRPTTVVIFGNPKVGTKLMQCDQRVGADLPLKILVWQDENGKNWAGYWKPTLLTEKYDLDGCKAILEKMNGAMAKFLSIATQ